MSLDAPRLSSVSRSSNDKLDELFADALCRDPERRPSSCGELIEQLARAAHAPNPAKTAVAKKKQTLLGHPTTPPPSRVLSIEPSPLEPVSHEAEMRTESPAPRAPRLRTLDRIELPPSRPSRRAHVVIGVVIAIALIAIGVFAAR